MTDGSGGYTDHPFVAEFYDQAYRGRTDIPFYVEMARESRGVVLEAACGTGRILLPIARAGIEITGIDLSKPMLEVCRRKLAAEPDDVQRRVRLEQADMRGFDLGRRFALVTVPFRAFQHLITVEDELSCLAALRRHVSPGGRLILDLFNPSMPALTDASHFEEWGDEPEFPLADGRRVQRRFRIARRDWNAQVQDVEMYYNVTYPDGQKERLLHEFPMRYLFRFEAEHLLARAGFEVEAVYSDFERTPFGPAYPGDLLLVARVAA